MALFRKRKHRPLSERQERLAGRVASAIVLRQIRVANYLNRKTQYWNRGSKIIALGLFSLVFGGLSLLLLIRAFIIIHH